MIIEHATCPACGNAYDPVRSRAVRVVSGRVRAFCSSACRDRGILPQAPTQLEPDSDEPPARRFGFPAVVAAAVVAVVGVGLVERAMHRSSAARASASLLASAEAMKPPHTPSPSEALAMLTSKPTVSESDAWIHPLAGPTRKLPRANTRRFGAAREGMRPEECMGGHCGVDLGSTKGEVVMAVHDGVIERVERDAEVGGRRGNEGRFIRINHKGGTVVSSYMHLDGIREDLKPGIPVKVGEAIGTIGDTGVKISGPHLHFAVSVRASADEQELFIDPEPMLHLWPLQAHPVASLHAMEKAPPTAPRTAQAESTQEGM